MRYHELRRHVWLLWREARHQDEIPAQYREWIVARTVERVIDAQLHHDNAAHELGQHLIHDYGRHIPDQTEHDRFHFWWDHVMNFGFNTPNPLRHLHKPRPKATTK